MPYIAPIQLDREALLKRRGGVDEAAMSGEPPPCTATGMGGPGGCRRRVERLRSVEHCSKVLLARTFATLPDAFRFFLCIPDARVGASQDFFLSDAQLESCFVTPRQLQKGLQQLLLTSKPHPAPLAANHRRGEGRVASGAVGWQIDIDDILEEVRGLAPSLSFLDFMRLFEWDVGQGAETQLQLRANSKHLEYQVRMEIREKTIVGKWKFFSLAVRSRVVYWRWAWLTSTFAWTTWKNYAKQASEIRRKNAIALAHALETQARRALDCWLAFKLQVQGEGQQGLANARQEMAAAQFLRRHPFIKTPSEAFLAGLTHGSVEVVCLDGEEGAGLRKLSLYDFVKSHPLRSAQQQTGAVQRPGTAASELKRLPGRTTLASAEQGGQVKIAVGSPASLEMPSRAPVDRVELYGSEPAVSLQTINGRPNFQYTPSRRLPLSANCHEYLLIQPAVIHFEGFLNLGHKHGAKVTITNLSGRTRKIRVLPAQSRYFVVHMRNPRSLAPGLSAQVQIVFTPQEKRSYYDCIRIKTDDDSHREYVLPVHGYPGKQMVLEHVPAPLPQQHGANWTRVQDVWRLEQLALTTVDSLRPQLKEARLKLETRFDGSAKLVGGEREAANALHPARVAAWKEAGGQDWTDADEAERQQELTRQHEEEASHQKALEEMQAEMRLLEEEIFLGPGVEFGPKAHVGVDGLPVTSIAGNWDKAATCGRGGGSDISVLLTAKPDGRNPRERPIDYPFRKPVNPHPRGTPTPAPKPWQYCRLSEYIPYASGKKNAQATARAGDCERVFAAQAQA